jgi:hypothetical protein
MWHIEPTEPQFSRAERKFLSHAGRATVPADVLLERVYALVGTERPSRGRQAYLAAHLLEQGLFLTLEEASAFADSFYALAKEGKDFQKLTWDWE